MSHETGSPDSLPDAARNDALRTALIRRIHDSPVELVLAVSGGGSLVIGDLLNVPGGSRTLLEATVPYTQAAIDDYIKYTPEHYCCERTARLLAMAAFSRGCELIAARKKRGDDDGKRQEFTDPGEVDLIDHAALVGIGCTASLSTDREKKGEYRVCVAAQTNRRTVVCALELRKGKRNRFEEERLAADLVLDMILNTSPFLEPEPDDGKPSASRNGVGEQGQPVMNAFSEETGDFVLRQEIPLGLDESEKPLLGRTVATPALVDLFFGKTAMILWRSGRIEALRSREECELLLHGGDSRHAYNQTAEFSNAIFPGSFNPIHEGHLGMLEIARNRLSCVVSLEISVRNAQKPPLDYLGLHQCLQKIEQRLPGQPVWLTRASTFREKATIFPGTTFVVGADTLRRFADLDQYDNHPHTLQDILREIAACDCRFLVFARRRDDVLESLETLDIPDMLRSLCDEIPASEFTLARSSTDIRRREDWYCGLEESDECNP